MKATIILVAMLLILATAVLVIVFNFREPLDLTGTRCTCPVPECPHVVKAPQDETKAEMEYAPYQTEVK